MHVEAIMIFVVNQQGQTKKEANTNTMPYRHSVPNGIRDDPFDWLSLEGHMIQMNTAGANRHPSHQALPPIRSHGMKTDGSF